MGKRNIAAVMILIGGAVASFYCYAHLSQLLPMSDKDMVTQVQATITQVEHDVRFSFQAAGKTYEGSYAMRDRDRAPQMGAKLPVMYYTSHPAMFLRQDEYNALPHRLAWLRGMMVSFALVAIIAPFGVMKHG